MLKPLSAAVVASLLVPTAASAASARAEPQEVVLPGEARAVRRAEPCTRGIHAGLAGLSCFFWSFQGLRGPLPFAREDVSAVARAGARRIVVIALRDAWTTDDQGASWQHAAIDDSGAAPTAIEFATDGRRGFGVGGDGTVWTSSDAGAHWRLRRDDDGTYVECHALEAVAVLVAGDGAVRVFDADAGSVRSLFAARGEDARPSIRREGATLVVTPSSGDGAQRVHGDGQVETAAGTQRRSR